MDWQTVIAAGIVIITLVIFAVQLTHRKKKSGCGHNCGCDKPKDP